MYISFNSKYTVCFYVPTAAINVVNKQIHITIALQLDVDVSDIIVTGVDVQVVKSALLVDVLWEDHEEIQKWSDSKLILILIPYFDWKWTNSLTMKYNNIIFLND